MFAATKPGAVLINVARGEEVDEDALVEAVTAGRIRGAVLDVYAGELAGQPPRPELTGLPQILLTPHISGGGEANMAGPLRQLFAGNLRRYLDGQPLLNVVDRSRGYLQGPAVLVAVCAGSAGSSWSRSWPAARSTVDAAG